MHKYLKLFNRAIHQLGQLSFDDWVLVFQVLPALVCSRMLILFLPFRRLQPVLGSLNYVTSSDSSGEMGYVRIKRIGIILCAVSKYLPWRSMCLEQALAGMMLLRCKGCSSTIYFGVHHFDKTIKAHAWLRCGDQIVTGAAGRECFTIVFTVASKSSQQFGLEPFELPVSNSKNSQINIAREHR